MTVRSWRSEDLKNIADAEEKCFSDSWNFSALEAEFSNPFCHCFLAEEGGQVLGYCCLFVLFEDAEVHNIAVVEEHRGKGIAQTLMDKMHEKAKALGAERSLLEVRVSNTPAISLYEKNGYETYGVRASYYTDGEDAQVMWKTL